MSTGAANRTHITRVAVHWKDAPSDAVTEGLYTYLSLGPCSEREALEAAFRNWEWGMVLSVWIDKPCEIVEQ